MDNLEKLETLGTHDEDKQNKKHNTICIGNHYTQTHTYTSCMLSKLYQCYLFLGACSIQLDRES